MSSPSRRHGFTLVELSIVLVIIGLLVGGVLVGRDLIAAARIRKITSTYTSYETSIFAFRDKYQGYPGDIANASAFWPTAGNGNNDRQIAWWAESIYIWQHLGLAGMIAGTYSVPATYGADAATSVDIGISHPDIGDGQTMQASYGAITTAAGSISKNWLALAHDPQNFWISVCSDGNQGCLTGHDVQNIDIKLDDGLPMTGKTVINWTHGHCLNGSSVADWAYNTLTTTTYCTVMMPF